MQFQQHTSIDSLHSLMQFQQHISIASLPLTNSTAHLNRVTPPHLSNFCDKIQSMHPCHSCNNNNNSNNNTTHSFRHSCSCSKTPISLLFATNQSLHPSCYCSFNTGNPFTFLLSFVQVPSNRTIPMCNLETSHSFGFSAIQF
jgi:hypothetical protein